MKLMSMMPLSTAMPESAMKPTAALMVKGIPRAHSAKMPPVTASGTHTKISAACRTEPKLRNSSTKMKASASGTTIIRRSFAFTKLRNCPPNSK